MFLFFSILGGTAISLAGFIKMLLNSRRNKKIKRKLIKEIMDSKGMSKEDATKVTNYSIQKALEMTPEQLKRLSDKSKEKEVQKLMKNGQTVPGGNIN
jgi:DNA polymerase III psi subunit